MTFRLDHASFSQQLLASQFSGATQLRALVAALAVNRQEIEGVFTALMYRRALLRANGVQLDALGDLLQEPRKGLRDPRYRVALQAAALRNASGGTPNDMIDLTRALTGAATITYSEPATAEAAINHDGEVVLSLPRRLREIAPAGLARLTVTQPGLTPAEA